LSSLAQVVHTREFETLKLWRHCALFIGLSHVQLFSIVNDIWSSTVSIFGKLVQKLHRFVSFVQEYQLQAAFQISGKPHAQVPPLLCSVRNTWHYWEAADRGPNGVWTLKRAGKPIPRLGITLAAAKPTYTHQVSLNQTLPWVIHPYLEGADTVNELWERIGWSADVNLELLM
jgi:hypothetical protein